MLFNAPKMCLHEITPVKMSCHAQWPIYGIRKRHPKRLSGTNQIAFAQQSSLVKEYTLLVNGPKHYFQPFCKAMQFNVYSVNGGKVDRVSLRVQQKHTTIN